MVKRFLGMLLVTVGVLIAAAACGNASDIGALTPMPSPTTKSALLVTAPPGSGGRNTLPGTVLSLPTATVEVAGDGQEPGGMDAIEAQLSRGWPTLAGDRWGPTPTFAPTPVDKSKWTIIEPGECDPDSTIRVGKIDELRRTLFAFISTSWAKNDADLVNMSDLIIHGVPTGSIEIAPPRFRGFESWVYQDVRILEVLSGQAPGDTVRVLQLAYDYATSEENQEKYQITMGTAEDHGYPGPLGQCPQILFLVGSSASVYPSVGLTQGVFSLGLDGRVTYAPEFESFLGLDVAGVKQRVEELSSP